MKAAGVSGKSERSIMKSEVMPKTQRPTTSRPQTAPPRSAVSIDSWYERVAAAAVRRGFARQERLRVRLERALELGAFAAVQHVVPDLLARQHLGRQVVAELPAHLHL